MGRAIVKAAARFVGVPGGRLHAVEEGSGSPLVLLHAGIVDSRGWEPLVPLLVDAGHRVVRFDARGAGRSETDDVEFSSRADVVAVMDAFGISRACLIGSSRGGQIAIDTAVEYPDRVRALVTLGANIGGFEPEPTAEEQALFEELERLEELGDPDAVADFDVRLWVDGVGQPVSRVPAELREWIRTMDRDLNSPGRVGGRPIRLDPPAAARLGTLRMPVLAIAGALDVSDVWATARHLELTCSNARAVLLPDAAHMIAVEQPDVVAGLVAPFIRRLGAFA